jgi:uncharacterized membrane protein
VPSAQGQAQQPFQATGAPGYAPPAAPVLSEAQDAQENKMMAVLAYFLFFVPLLVGAHKTSPFVRYHANQGTILFIFAVAFSLVYGVIIGIVTGILAALYAWFLMSVILPLLSLLYVLPLVLCIMGIVNAAQGRMRPLPIIGKFTIIK